MPIPEIQRRLTQLGVIRLGRQVPTGNVKNGQPTYRPEKLDRFRVTSPDEDMVKAVAAAYGGTVQPWAGPSGPEFEVITDSKQLPVLVPPQRIDPNYESWGRGFRSRLCDGITERQRNSPCLCIKGPGDHVHDFQFGGPCECGARRECKPTTRLSLMLREIPGLGVLKLESHGRNAAAELPMTSDALENAPAPVPATLVAQFVEKKILVNAGRPNEKVEPRSFYVPRLVFSFVTPGQVFSGQLGAAAKVALSGGEQRQAIGATAADAVSAKRLMSMVGKAKNRQQLASLWEDAKAVPADDPDLEALKAEFARQGEVIKAADRPTAQPPAPAAAPVDEVVDAEIVEDPQSPEAQSAWMQILSEAGNRGWDQAAVDARYRERMGHDAIDAGPTKLAQFLAALRAGEVA